MVDYGRVCHLDGGPRDGSDLPVAYFCGICPPVAQHCDPVACFVGVLEKPELGSEAIPANCLVIGLPDSSGMYGVSWDEVVKGTERCRRIRCAVRKRSTIIYTSGTTGLPKGAMHRFSAFPFLAKAVAQVVGEVRHRAMSYLPLAHIAERSLTETDGSLLRLAFVFR